MKQQKRTKIVATLGPSTDNPVMMEKMIIAGLDVVRVNFSHGTAAEHQNRIELVRNAAAKLNRQISILADLQGPKIRVAKFKQGKIELKTASQFVLDAELATNMGDEHAVGIDYKELPNDVHAGDTLLLDDGRLVFKVINVEGKRINCMVEVGGELSNNKGINRLGGGLTAPALTDKDKADIKIAADLKVDYVAVSFPRSAADIEEAKKLLEQAGSKAGIIAKIERTEAIAVLDEIIKVSDGVMVARGDLAVEIGDAEVPGVQKLIIQRARSLDKPVITATQMVESMIHSTVPTRAEVSDVANAVLDGTDAVMLSAESAVGDHPDLVITTLARVCMAAERSPRTNISGHRMECYFNRVDEAIAMATMYTANHLNIKAIIALTESGATPLWMSRIRSGIPIYGMTSHSETLRKMTLYRGVYPIKFDAAAIKRWEVNKAVVAELEAQGLVKQGDLVILTKGDHLGVHGGTNAMKILQVGNID